MTLDLAPPTVQSSSKELSQYDVPCLYAFNALPDLVRLKSGRARPIPSYAALFPHATVREIFARPSRSSGSLPRTRAHDSRSTRPRQSSGAAVWCFALLYASFFAMWPISVSAMLTPTTALASSALPCATCTPLPSVLPRQLESGTVSTSPSETSSSLPQESSTLASSDSSDGSVTVESMPTSQVPRTSQSSPLSQSSQEPPSSESSASSLLPTSASSQPSSATSQPPNSLSSEVSSSSSQLPTSLSASSVSASAPVTSLPTTFSLPLSVSLSIAVGPSSRSPSSVPSSAPRTSTSRSALSSSTPLTSTSSSSALSSTASTSDVSFSSLSTSLSTSSISTTVSSTDISASLSASSVSTTGSSTSTSTSAQSSSVTASISASPSSVSPPTPTSELTLSTESFPTASVTSWPLFPASSSDTEARTSAVPVRTTTSRSATFLTTIVVTSVYTTSGSIRATTVFTTAVATGTLIPNGGSSANRNALAHNPGAIAGLVIGVVAFIILIAVWIFFARRRHLTRLSEAEDAALGGPPGSRMYGRAVSGRPRTAVLDDEDVHDIEQPMSPMVERQASAILAAAGLAGGQYASSDNPFEPTDDGAAGERLRGGNSAAASGFGIAAAGGSGSDEAYDFMRYRSMPPSTTSLQNPPPPRPPRSPRRPRTSSGPSPAAWFGGKDLPFSDAPTPIITQGYSSGVQGPLPSPGPGGMSSSDGHGGSDPSASASDMHLVSPGSPLPVPYVNASRNGSGASMTAGMFESGPGSSAHGHSGSIHGHSSSGHEHGISSQGHSSSSGNRNSQILESRPRSPVPSSLLPSQSQPFAPPTAFRGAAADGKAGGRKRGSVIGKSLKWVRNSRPGSPPPRPSSSSSQSRAASPPPFSPPKFSEASSSVPLVAPTPTTSASRPRSGSANTLMRAQSPVLATMPPPAFASYGAIPESGGSNTQNNSLRVPFWPGLGTLAAPDMPSPALTEGSSHLAPEGLLDPNLGLRQPGAMHSTAAISFRDEVDYSRPIGGLVNNRVHSTSTIPTLMTARRYSGESGRSVAHMDTSALRTPTPS